MNCSSHMEGTAMPRLESGIEAGNTMEPTAGRSGRDPRAAKMEDTGKRRRCRVDTGNTAVLRRTTDGSN